MPAEAPKAEKVRKTASQPRLGASAQPRVLMANTANPIASGWRRPKRSDKVPWTAGKAGRYMSVAAGPTAMKKPSRRGSQAGTGAGGAAGWGAWADMVEGLRLGFGLDLPVMFVVGAEVCGSAAGVKGGCRPGVGGGWCV